MNPHSGKGTLGRCLQQKQQTAAPSLHSRVSSHTLMYILRRGSVRGEEGGAEAGRWHAGHLTCFVKTFRQFLLPAF